MAKGWKPSTHVSVVCACSIKRLVHVLLYSCHCDAFSSPAPAGSKRRPFCDCRRVVLTGKSCFDGAICMQRHRTPTPALLDSQLTETATIIPLQRQRPSAHGCLRLRTQKLVQMQAHISRLGCQVKGQVLEVLRALISCRPAQPARGKHGKHTNIRNSSADCTVQAAIAAADTALESTMPEEGIRSAIEAAARDDAVCKERP